MTRVYFDLDDTLVDFSGGLEKFNIQNDVTFLHRPKSQWTPLQIKLDREVIDCMNTPGFFRDLPMMEGAQNLWCLVKRPRVLTAWPTTCNDRDRVGREKLEWVENHFKQMPHGEFIYCARQDKQRYAISDNYPWPSSNILVDDMEDNCQQWEASGGIAIHFKNTKQAIIDLNKVLSLLN